MSRRWFIINVLLLSITGIFLMEASYYTRKAQECLNRAEAIINKIDANHVDPHPL